MSQTPLRETDELTVAAARLARAAPSSWSDFLKTFSAVGALRAKECVQAPADKVVLAQGRAQQCADLLDLFSNAVARADQLAQKMK